MIKFGERDLRVICRKAFLFQKNGKFQEKKIMLHLSVLYEKRKTSDVKKKSALKSMSVTKELIFYT